MATGIVVGLSKHRHGWSSSVGRPDGIHLSTRSTEVSSTAMSSTSHHRSYSDAPDRFRLPPISNLIDGAGRSDYSYRSPYQSPPVQPQFQSGLPQGRAPPTSPDSTTWSPGRDSRVPYQQQPHQHYEHRPITESYFSSTEYRRASLALPHLSHSGVRHGSIHALPQPVSDPLSPDGCTTAKSVVREEIIPGKGLCYVYDDGSICQKVINGDTVNPKWGTTKAGKPRKRLGQACNTCREKKIKCDPSFPKCTQCQKFGRDCKFEAPSRSGNKSPRMRPGSSPSATQFSDDTNRTRRPSVALTEASSHSESGTISSRAAGTVEDNLSPLTNDSNFVSDVHGPSKRVRLTQVDPEISLSLRAHGSSHDVHQSFALDMDPYKVDKKLVEAYLGAYFTHINNPAFSLVPERMFMDWVEHVDDKPSVSKLVLYCMLALGCSFSKSAEKFTHQRIFSSIAQEGITQSFGHFSIQLVQARLIFALYEFQAGREDRAWDLCGSAMRAACTMNLHTEDGIAMQLRENNSVYSLDETRLAECMRRTFWMAYTVDCLGAAYLCITTTFNKPYCDLQLPCNTQAYERGNIPRRPTFDGDIHSFKPTDDEDQANIGTLGYVVQIASLSSDVRALAFKANHRANPNRQKRYASKREELESLLRIWNENYTTHMNRKYTQRSHTHGGYPFPFGGLHLMYHYACMQLYRQVSYSHLSRGKIVEHARMAQYHAEKTLVIAGQLMGRRSQNIYNYHFAVSSPLSGYAIHYAIDIVSAIGINAKLLENQSPMMGLMINGAELLDDLADTWASAKLQKQEVSERVRGVNFLANQGLKESKVGFCMEEPMVTNLNKEEDLVYGVDRMQYIRAFDWTEAIKSPSDLTVVSGKGKRGSYSVWKD